MRVLILGGDGYLGWPTAMAFAARGHEVWTVDNYLRRRIAQETCSEALIPTPNLIDRTEILPRRVAIKSNPLLATAVITVFSPQFSRNSGPKR